MTARRNGIGGFIVEKLDGKVMRRYVKDNELDKIETEDATDEHIAVALSMHFKNTLKKDDQVKCDNCEGISNANDARCAYCGDAGEVEDQEETPTMVKEAVSDEEIEDTDEDTEEEDEDTDEEDEDEEEEEAKPKKATKKVVVKDEDADEDEDEEEEEAKPVKKKAAKAAVEDDEDEEEEAPVKKAKKSSTELVKREKGGLVTAKELDKAIVEVEKLKGAAAESYWELGKKILEIQEKQLWKLRVKDNGAPKYKGFDAFVHNELKMSPQHAYNAIDVAKGYDDPAEVRALGHTKAALILKAAPEDRAKLTSKAKAGATKRALAKDVKESRAKHGSPKKDSPKAKAGAAGAVSKAKTDAVRSEKISIASIEGTKAIKLYAKPESLRGLDFKTLKRATSIKDVPFGRFEMTGGVVQYFSVIVKEGQFLLKIETRRESSS